MLAERMKNLSGSKTSNMRTRARKLRSEGINVINFAAGELDRDTSPIIKKAVQETVEAGRTQYTDTLGIKELRERLALKVSQKTGSAYTAEEVGFTAGAKQALFNANMTLFGPGDEVIIPAPYWVTFPEQVRLAGASPVFLATAHNSFQIDTNELERLITPRTKGIILNSPHNPTGAVYNPDVLEGVARIILQNELTCIFDECYEALVYPPAVHYNLVKLVPELKRCAILIGSFSKTYCMAGWRAGFIAGPQAVVKAVANLQSHTASNACNLIQYAAMAALEPDNEDFVEGVRNELLVQRSTALECLKKIPALSCTVPSGAFYLFPDVSALLGRSFQGQRIENVSHLSELLLEHAHIAVVPGSAFGSENHIRLSYAIPAAEIKAGFQQLEQFVKMLA